MEHPFAIEPDAYSVFADEGELIENCKQWGLLSGKAVKSKAFVYKRAGASLSCSVIGFVDSITAVIEFDNKQRHCIHPSLLKEMQASGYGLKNVSAADPSEGAEPGEAEAPTETEDAATGTETTVAAEDAAPPADAVQALSADAAEPQAANKEPATAGKAKKEKAAKPQLPEEKVKMVATVLEFTTVPNHFTEAEDEVIVYEAVALLEPAVDIGAAWSSNSATMKKLELKVGDTITFEGKIVAKKLTKHPVPYKINNPGKIVKS